MVDKAKAENLILYVCRQMDDCPETGAIVLNKVLYYIDHLHYLRYGKKLTGFAYIKQRFGPTPKPSEFLPIRQALIDSDRLEEKTVDYFGRAQKRLYAKERADLSLFTQDEVALIGEIVNSLSGINGKLVSEITHDELSWKLADLMEELPDYAYLLTEAQLEQSDLDWAKKVINGYSPTVC